MVVRLGEGADLLTAPAPAVADDHAELAVGHREAGVQLHGVPQQGDGPLGVALAVGAERQGILAEGLERRGGDVLQPLTPLDGAEGAADPLAHAAAQAIDRRQNVGRIGGILAQRDERVARLARDQPGRDHEPRSGVRHVA